jgi:hypothetical protein
VSEEKIRKWEKYLIRLVIIIDLQMRNNKCHEQLMITPQKHIRKNEFSISYIC